MSGVPGGASSDGLDLETVLLCSAAVGLGSVWGGAQVAARLATGRWLDAGAGDAFTALVRLPSSGESPASAWGPEWPGALPGPTLYWGATLAVAVAAITLVVALHRLLTHQRVGTDKRHRLGVDTRSRLARRQDLKPLIVRGPVAGRLILGKVGSSLVATEDRTSSPRWRQGARQGDRSAVAVIGPTRCGKTANAISGVLEWNGPAILFSVKNDLLAATLDVRRKLGEVRVFDPTRATKVAERAGWSPLRAAATPTGAQKAARALADAGPKDGAENLKFFGAMAEQLLWPLLYTAAAAGRSMVDVVRWVLSQDRPVDGTLGEVASLLDAELVGKDALRRSWAAAAMTGLAAIWDLDERTRGSTYATAQTLVRLWQDPDVATSSLTQDIDLAWLLKGANTLYLCGPLHEQDRLATVFGGLLGDLMQQAYETAGKSETGVLTPTLVVLDEAGNTPMRWLPQVASTCAGIGLLLVTIWQSKAQIDAAYGTLADSVLTNHGSKVIFSGVSDRSTLDYASSLLGDEEVRQRSLSADPYGGHRNISESTTRTNLVPGDLLRQMLPGHALLLHGTLRPAHLLARPYYKNRRWRKAAEAAWTLTDAEQAKPAADGAQAA
ncbi:MAG: type IV secretory system conjugative DNA transfer family protein [Actinomycetota bacterium]|nr:type IV secretory system conjugative DNA transfer family protein [Actinomycetota bacterium]